MIDHDPPSPRHTRAILLALVAGFVIVLAGIAFWIGRPSGPSAASVRLDQKLAQLRSNGVPLTAEEVANVFPDPDSEHDARVILKPAFDLLPQPRSSTNLPIVGPGKLTPRTAPLPSEMMKELQLYLTNSDALLESIPRRLEGVWYSMRWTNGLTNLLSLPFVQVRSLHQTLALKAIYEAERKDERRAGDALRKSFGVLGTQNNDLSVNAMIRIGCSQLASEATEQALNRVQLRADDLADLQALIRPDISDDFRRTFIADRHTTALALDQIRAIYARGGVEKQRLALWSLYNWFRAGGEPIYRDEDYLTFLETVDARAALHGKSGLEQIQTHTQLDAAYETNTASLFARLSRGAWARASRGAVETKAKLICTRTAVAVERFRLAHTNALPKSLDELVPDFLAEAPRDPLDNQPLRFKKLATGYLLYSIGADGVDNGGTERPSSTVTNNYDVTFTVER